MIHFLSSPATQDQFRDMQEVYTDMIKVAVDVRKGTLAGGGEMHADCEKVLIDNGSEQSDIWGSSKAPDSVSPLRFPSPREADIRGMEDTLKKIAGYTLTMRLESFAKGTGPKDTWTGIVLGVQSLRSNLREHSLGYQTNEGKLGIAFPEHVNVVKPPKLEEKQCTHLDIVGQKITDTVEHGMLTGLAKKYLENGKPLDRAWLMETFGTDSIEGLADILAKDSNALNLHMTEAWLDITVGKMVSTIKNASETVKERFRVSRRVAPIVQERKIEQKAPAFTRKKAFAFIGLLTIGGGLALTACTPTTVTPETPTIPSPSKMPETPVPPTKEPTTKPTEKPTEEPYIPFSEMTSIDDCKKNVIHPDHMAEDLTRLKNTDALENGNGFGLSLGGFHPTDTSPWPFLTASILFESPVNIEDVICGFVPTKQGEGLFEFYMKTLLKMPDGTQKPIDLFLTFEPAAIKNWFLKQISEEEFDQKYSLDAFFANVKNQIGKYITIVMFGKPDLGFTLLIQNEGFLGTQELIQNPNVQKVLEIFQKMSTNQAIQEDYDTLLQLLPTTPIPCGNIRFGF